MTPLGPCWQRARPCAKVRGVGVAAGALALGAALRAHQPCELCCGAVQAVDALVIKQQQCCCALGGVFCDKRGSAGATAPWSCRTRTRPRGRNALHKWPRRNAADSSPIYSGVPRAAFWLGCAAVLLPEAKEPDFGCVGSWHFGRPVRLFAYSHVVKGGSCFNFPVTLKNNCSLHA